ncbi:MAG: ATP-grasp domain-containing protein [Deltaproteobacteria bacterium]|nr:ATP-grasp domain-containing protein [Deltaproteobacteria bacterium]
MNVEKVLVVFNDDGPENLTHEGEELEFGDLSENAEAIREALLKQGFHASILGLNQSNFKDFVETISKKDFDMVFNLCEGAFGLSNYELNVAALFELFDVSFTGNGPLTLGVALNKGWTKDILRGMDVPTAESVVADDLPFELPEYLSFPVMVKPVSEDASTGIDADSVVYSQEELERKIDMIFKEYEQSALIEEYIDGREFNIAVIGNYDDVRALPPSEIDFSKYPEGQAKIISYEAKWIETSKLYLDSPPVCPADVSKELKEYLHATAIDAFETLECRDYARVDMRLGTDGELRVLEVNPNPDLSTDAGFARAAKAAGMDYSQLIAEIIKAAALRYE